jgi:photosynthetic reaction center H subunit
MTTGAITSHIDVAQVVLYAFWLFFAGLIIYIRREDKREGYPLESERSGSIRVQGFPAMPAAKTYRLPHGGEVQKPGPRAPEYELRAVATDLFPGAPLHPTGNAMTAGVGPGAYSMRADVPDLTLEGDPKIVPLRVTTEGYGIHPQGPDPRGMVAVGGDGKVGGVVTDAWVDKAEPQVRYLEVEVAGSLRHVLVPIGFAKVDGDLRRVVVRSIMGDQFDGVPALRNPDVITMLEEERVSAYYGAGTLYATSHRSEPLL